MTSPEPKPATPTQWLILIVAAIGFLSDICELLLLPLIATPAIANQLTQFDTQRNPMRR